MIFSTRMDETQADNWMDLAFTLETDSMTAHRCVEAAYQSLTHGIPMTARLCEQCDDILLDEGWDAANPFPDHACNHCQTEILPEGTAASNPLADFNPRIIGDQKI